MKHANYLIAALVLLLLGTTAFAQIPSYVPTNGLVGWWPFNGNANDESGNGNNGTVNGATLTSDRFANPGKAYDFDGVDDYIQVPDNNSLDLVNQFTLSTWFRIPDYTVSPSIPNSLGHTDDPRAILSKPRNAGWAAGFGIGHAPNGQATWICSGAANMNCCPNTGVCSQGVPPLNSWIQATSSYDGTAFRLYINGSLDNSVTGPISLDNSTEPLLIGKEFVSVVLNWYRWFKGQIDDIGIWNRALSPCEIRGLYLSQTQAYASADTVSTCSSYTWPVTGQNYTQSGSYSDTLQSVQGCDSIVGLELTILQPTSATLTESACGSYTLNGQSYSQTGNYTQTLVNAAGCDSVITLNLTITNLSASVSFAGGTLTASPSGATYQWVNCEQGYQPIAGSTGQSYTPDSTGNYAVVVTSGPCTDTSACTSVVVVGMENGLQQVITLYPNPTEGLLNVAGLPDGSKYQLMDPQGRKIMKGSGSGSLTLDLSHLPAGVYMLSLEAQGSKLHRKVVVEK